MTGYKLVCLVKPRRTRKEELQEAARQRVAATLAKSNARNRLYGGQSSEGRKAGGPRRPRGTSTSKPTPVQGIEHEGAKTTVKPATTASNMQEGKYYDFFLPFLPASLPLPSPPSALSPLSPLFPRVRTVPSSLPISLSSCVPLFTSRYLRLVVCFLFTFYIALILLKSKF